jgi:hypothetical protein
LVLLFPPIPSEALSTTKHLPCLIFCWTAYPWWKHTTGQWVGMTASHVTRMNPAASLPTAVGTAHSHSSPPHTVHSRLSHFHIPSAWHVNWARRRHSFWIALQSLRGLFKVPQTKKVLELPNHMQNNESR